MGECMGNALSTPIPPAEIFLTVIIESRFMPFFAIRIPSKACILSLPPSRILVLTLIVEPTASLFASLPFFFNFPDVCHFKSSFHPLSLPDFFYLPLLTLYFQAVQAGSYKSWPEPVSCATFLFPYGSPTSAPRAP